METKYLIISAGVLLFVLLTLQLLSGLRIIKITPTYHKWGGIILFIIALIHAIAGLVYILA